MLTLDLDGHAVIIDKDNLNLWLEYDWRSVQKPNERVYIVTTNFVCLHRLIAGAKPKEIVDHINGNTLDNRRENLRIVSNRVNSQNSYLRRENKTASKYIGVTIHKCKGRIKWRARFYYHGTGHVSLGVFKTELEAAIAYDTYVINNVPTEHQGNLNGVTK